MQQKKAHFIGICGVGMSATAHLLKEQGWSVSGSDEGFYPPVSEYLKSAEITCLTPYSPSNIPADTDLIVIGKNAKLTPEENAEVKAAFESGITVQSFPEVLHDLSSGTHNLVVVGSYGKSTCTALLSWCLIHADKDPKYVIGALPKEMKTTSHLGSGNVFVLEGDEYPSSNWDPTAKFLHYNARDVLLTSAVHDHVNIFPTLEDYHKPFEVLLETIPQDGLLVACTDEKHAQNFFETFSGTKTSYGLNDTATWSATNISYGKTTTFDLTKDSSVVTTLETKLLGAHNVQNIIGVAALLLERELVTPEELKGAIASFEGIVRRLDLKSEQTTVPVYEGFGSSHEKAAAAIAAIRLHHPDKQLIILFEPHTFTWRNRNALSHYDDIFKDSDLTLIYEPATQGAGTHEQLTQEEIVSRVISSGVDARAITSKEEGLALLEQELKADNVILLLTSGDLGGLIDGTIKFVEEKFPI